jgi:hypothetical protein
MNRRNIGSVVFVFLALIIGGTQCKRRTTTWMKHQTHPFQSTNEPGVEKTSLVLPLNNTPSDFIVDFSGLIVQSQFTANGTDSSPRRAILVEGDASMPHVPRLIVDKPTDSTQLANLIQELTDATGNAPDCNDGKLPDRCVVVLAGIDMRIRGDGGDPNSKVTGTLGYDAKRSFDCLLPHLKSESAGSSAETDIRSTLLLPEPALPASPATAYFEIDGGGMLSACPFKLSGFYNANSSACRQFASNVFWTGTTNNTAVLQLRSRLTGNTTWKTIDIGNTGLLDIALTNEPPNPISMTSGHFVLFNKVLGGGKVPTVTSCPIPVNVCIKCSGPRVVIPGCSDSAWP